MLDEQEVKTQSPAEQKKQQQKPLAERLEGQEPFNWIKLEPKTEAN
jgi:hypothetical protein